MRQEGVDAAVEAGGGEVDAAFHERVREQRARTGTRTVAAHPAAAGDAVRARVHTERDDALVGELDVLRVTGGRLAVPGRVADGEVLARVVTRLAGSDPVAGPGVEVGVVER